jgi:hypothetical protein
MVLLLSLSVRATSLMGFILFRLHVADTRLSLVRSQHVRNGHDLHVALLSIKTVYSLNAFLRCIPMTWY